MDDDQNNQDDSVAVSTDTSVANAQADDAQTQGAHDEQEQDHDSNNDELLEIKRSALQELSPLLDTLDQEPEEKFQTTMMMIQATDNKELIAKAYEAAKQIAEDKARAQALLDIVNEINYFTQGKSE